MPDGSAQTVSNVTPPEAAVIAASGDTEALALPLKWQEVLQLFAAERWYWLATGSNDGRPQQRPVLAVCIANRIFSTTSMAARKARNLAQQSSASLAARAPSIDIVIEGRASWVDDMSTLHEVATAYLQKYGWPVEVRADGDFAAPYGAPTAGPGPYRVYELMPEIAFGFGTDNDLGVRSTRYRFHRESVGLSED